VFQIRVGFQLPSGSIVGLVRLIHEEKNGWVNWRGGWASSQFFAAMTWASTSLVGFSFLSSAMKESSTSLGFRTNPNIPFTHSLTFVIVSRIVLDEFQVDQCLLGFVKSIPTDIQFGHAIVGDGIN